MDLSEDEKRMVYQIEGTDQKIILACVCVVSIAALLGLGIWRM